MNNKSRVSIKTDISSSLTEIDSVIEKNDIKTHSSMINESKIYISLSLPDVVMKTSEEEKEKKKINK